MSGGVLRIAGLGLQEGVSEHTTLCSFQRRPGNYQQRHSGVGAGLARSSACQRQ